MPESTKTLVFQPRAPCLIKPPTLDYDYAKPIMLSPRLASRLTMDYESPVHNIKCLTNPDDILNKNLSQYNGSPVKTKNNEVASALKETTKLSVAQLITNKSKNVIPKRSEQPSSTCKSTQSNKINLSKILEKGVYFNTGDVSVEEKGFIEIPDQRPCNKSRYTKTETKEIKKSPVVKADKKVNTAVTRSKSIPLPTKALENTKSNAKQTITPTMKENVLPNVSEKLKNNQSTSKICSNNKKNETEPNNPHLKDIDQKLQCAHKKNAAENKTKTCTPRVNAAKRDPAGMNDRTGDSCDKRVEEKRTPSVTCAADDPAVNARTEHTRPDVTATKVRNSPTHLPSKIPVPTMLRSQTVPPPCAAAVAVAEKSDCGGTPPTPCDPRLLVNPIVTPQQELPSNVSGYFNMEKLFDALSKYF